MPRLGRAVGSCRRWLGTASSRIVYLRLRWLRVLRRRCDWARRVAYGRGLTRSVGPGRCLGRVGYPAAAVLSGTSLPGGAAVGRGRDGRPGLGRDRGVEESYG